ncbi:hypothetical protein Q7C36_021009 [Tachysurus vachellii]|uniref:Uncharacterized protein n=1 Tax=Tachysurus vachellii TaxID=175792 RepID=A0AA88LR94_TACVA|nr:hypothetical protein Q7C36_021009 [Tachysurus vachellii]
MSVTVLDLSQTTDDAQRSTAQCWSYCSPQASALEQCINASCVGKVRLRRAARLGTARPNPLPAAVSFCPAASSSPPPAFFLPQIKRAEIWLHPGRSPPLSVVGSGQSACGRVYSASGHRAKVGESQVGAGRRVLLQQLQENQVPTLPKAVFRNTAR